MISKKKKKKGLRQYSGRFFSQFRKFKRMRGGLFSYGGGCFPFFTENRPQKHKKHAILHPSQANGGGSSPPPPPPWLRYCSSPKLRLLSRAISQNQTFEGGCFRMGGAIFHFSQKIGFNSKKSMRFCILHNPVGGLESPPPPLATLLCVCTALFFKRKN